MFCLLLAAAQFTEAQQMSMDMAMPSTPKNIFLTMMDTMMGKMDKVPVSGFVETDFVRQMIPHHEGAIEMANEEITHGKDFNMIQLAKSILEEQTIELQQMKLWVAKPA